MYDNVNNSRSYTNCRLGRFQMFHREIEKERENEKAMRGKCQLIETKNKKEEYKQP